VLRHRRREGPCGIDKSHNRQAETVGEAHEALRLDNLGFAMPKLCRMRLSVSWPRFLADDDAGLFGNAADVRR